MKFVIFVLDNLSNSGSPEEMNQINIFNEKLQTHGNWVYACGIVSPKDSYQIDYRGDNQSITAGSIMDENEFVSGFWIIEASDLSEAKTLAAQGSKACNRRVELHAQL